MKKIFIATLGGLMSFSALVNAETAPAKSTQLLAENGNAITVCYYRPKVWMGPGQRGFTVQLEGHTACALEYNFGVLYSTQHTYL